MCQCRAEEGKEYEDTDDAQPDCALVDPVSRASPLQQEEAESERDEHPQRSLQSHRDGEVVPPPHLTVLSQQVVGAVASSGAVVVRSDDEGFDVGCRERDREIRERPYDRFIFAARRRQGNDRKIPAGGQFAPETVAGVEYHQHDQREQQGVNGRALRVARTTCGTATCSNPAPPDDPEDDKNEKHRKQKQRRLLGQLGQPRRQRGEGKVGDGRGLEIADEEVHRPEHHECRGQVGADHTGVGDEIGIEDAQAQRDHPPEPTVQLRRPAKHQRRQHQGETHGRQAGQHQLAPGRAREAQTPSHPDRERVEGADRSALVPRRHLGILEDALAETQMIRLIVGPAHAPHAREIDREREQQKDQRDAAGCGAVHKFRDAFGQSGARSALSRHRV